MKTTKKTITLSNGKALRIVDKTWKRIEVEYRWFNTPDVFEALSMDRNTLKVTMMWPSEYERERNDPMAWISETALLLLPEKNQLSIEQRELILEMIRIQKP